MKASGQKDKGASPIFDPVAANAMIKAALLPLGWKTNVAIPEEVSFLGTDVDYLHSGLLAEAQFSNYPFLSQNVLRTALFIRSNTLFDGAPIIALVIIVKAHMIPASNGVANYEQAVSLVTSLIKHRVVDLPTRVVGLFAAQGVPVPAVWSEYPSARSRRPTSQPAACTLTVLDRKNAICKASIAITTPRA